MLTSSPTCRREMSLLEYVRDYINEHMKGKE